MSTQPATAEIKQLLRAWGGSDGAPSARAAVQHPLLFAGLTDTSGSPGTFTSTTSVLPAAERQWAGQRLVFRTPMRGTASY
jgi:hypothetical protein